MFRLETSGSWNGTKNHLTALKRLKLQSILESCGEEGARALSNATPRDSGVASESWSYKVKTSGENFEIVWTNSNIENGFPVVVRLHYGHGTGTGGYVPGRDFINPALRPVTDRILDKVMRAVRSA